MNKTVKKFPISNLSDMEEMKSKLQRLNLLRQKTDAIMAQFDLHLKMNTKRKTSIPQKLIYPTPKRRTLQPLSHRSNQNNSPTDKRGSDMEPVIDKSKIFHPILFNDHKSNTPHSTPPWMLNSPTNDEYSMTDSKQTPVRDPFHPDLQDDSHTSEYSYEKYRTTRSITSSSSPSKTSRDEPLLPADTLIIGRLYIINEIYPSIESEDLNGTPLAFLGSEKFLRLRIDWTQVRYPLSSYHIEIIIDLILARPSFIREIPKVTQFNLYQPLIQIMSGRLFFDHGERKASIHRCHRKLVNHKFTIDDLASIHRREFHIINYNVTREQRFISLYENLFPIHFYQTKSTSWQILRMKSKHPIDTSDNPPIHHRISDQMLSSSRSSMYITED